MKIVVLTYHSHNISGSDYSSNDHIALASDLEAITSLGARIVPLTHIAGVVRSGRFEGRETLVGLSFDDGPVFDFDDFVHPKFGMQRGFLNTLRDFRSRRGPQAQPGLHATSFVIASPDARAAMERFDECGYTYLQDWLSDGWWKAASDSGLMGIGNHSWDHVHSALESTCISVPTRDNFEVVDNYMDADREIRAATEFINARVEGRCQLFAFPFGHTNDYLLNDYLPRNASEHGMLAAFGTGGTSVRKSDSVWNIPRVVCGHHWRTPPELEALIKDS